MRRDKVLIIDDGRDFVEALSFDLEHSGYDVSVAYDGLEGIEKALDEIPDLIILDVRLPIMDGFQVLGRLRGNKITHEIPVIMLTAVTDSKFILQAQELKATDYVIKPSGLDRLKSLIAKYLQIYKSGEVSRDRYDGNLRPVPCLILDPSLIAKR